MQDREMLQPSAQPRSKLEFLYRELLIDIERLQQANDGLVNDLKAASITLSSMPAVLQKVAATAANQACSQSAQQLQASCAALASSEQDLRRAGKTLLNASTRNAWFVGAVAGACGLLGALVGGLVCLVVLTS
ncbi:hypothetical protein CSC67_07800 [Pusillimonas caeni]|uniref:hypothetical protein n=1 Tax=Pusillimonas caeni TaxID=1348472 RepID=UPI001074C33C|nr:hypothetical protein [Pusillimonas caeni]TFL14064.1 hypothetical protein CSC67_07800 [Pusillimonas caeni]